MKKSFIIVAVLAAFAAPAYAGSKSCTNPMTPGCDILQRDADRDTSLGRIVSLADHCSLVARYVGESVAVLVVPQGRKPRQEHKVLPGFTLAGTSKAADRRNFGSYDGRNVVLTELCKHRRLWDSALRQVGNSWQDLFDGKAHIYVCGVNQAGHLQAATKLTQADLRAIHAGKTPKWFATVPQTVVDAITASLQAN